MLCVINSTTTIPPADGKEEELIYPMSSSSGKTKNKVNSFIDLVSFSGKQLPPSYDVNKKDLLIVDTSAVADMTPPLTPVTLDNEDEESLGFGEQEKPCFCILPFLSSRTTRPCAIPVAPSPQWELHKSHCLTERTMPCDEDFFEELTEEELSKLRNKDYQVEIPDVDALSDSESSEQEEEETLPKVEDSIPVNLSPEPLHILTEYPSIISSSIMQQISDRGLPLTAKLMKWSRIYSLTRDGDYFQTMITNCASYHHTVVVIKTTRGDILGGYADSPWRKQDGYQLGSSFYGSGQAFLFATNPLIEKEVNGQDVSTLTTTTIEKTPYVHIYHWTGENTYCQVCDEDGGRIAMGGGGSFGLLVQDNFIIGSSGHCSTFGNPPLTREGEDGFDVLDMEVYGLKTALI